MNVVLTRFALCLLLLIHPVTGVLQAASAGVQTTANEQVSVCGLCCLIACECEPAPCCVTDKRRLPELPAPMLRLPGRDASFSAFKLGSYPDCKDLIASQRGHEANAASAASFTSIALLPWSHRDHQERRALLCCWLN